MANLFINELQPIIEKNATKQNIDKFQRGVGKYVDANSMALTKPGPTDRVIFGDRDRNVLYDAFKITPNDIMKTIKKSKDINSQWKFMNEPFNTGIALLIRHASLTKNDKLRSQALLYMALPIYGFMQRKYFIYDPIPEVMDYTIANLSNKYIIKQTGVMLLAIEETAERCFETQKDRIERGTDIDIIKFIMDLTTRLNSLMKNLSSEFYKNSDEKNYLNTDSDNFDEENYHMSDSDSYGVSRIAEAVTLNLVTDGPDSKHVSMAARMCGVSQNEVRNYINTLIHEDNHKDIYEMLEAIVYSYVVDGKHNAGRIRNNNTFLNYSLEVYRRSNTSNKNVIKIKEILDKWMEDLDVYKKTQRQATINNFRRAIYVFFVLTLMTNA